MSFASFGVVSSGVPFSFSASFSFFTFSSFFSFSFLALLDDSAERLLKEQSGYFKGVVTDKQCLLHLLLVVKI